MRLELAVTQKNLSDVKLVHFALSVDELTQVDSVRRLPKQPAEWVPLMDWEGFNKWSAKCTLQ